ncbi:MAG TPA: universal stress protein [Solirubrobacterales bacterium]|jgi:nucleotide-binding universal stress UspA family protein|nr:universal stress protein [Solirubrobacterales bacterium]
MTKILVGFDGSDGARDALRLGKALGRAEDAELLVGAVISYVPLPIEAEAYERALSEHYDELFDAVQQELAGATFERHELADTSVARALGQLAEDQGANLIVIGSTHRGTLGRVYPGSVGERLLNGAPCAVAVAPRGFARRDHFGLGVIGIAYDGTPESKLALTEGERLAEELGASLKLIAVVPDVPVSPARIGHTSAGYADALRQHFREVLDGAVSTVPGAGSAETILDEGDPAAALAARGVELDLLVIGSRGYGPLRRVLLGGVSAEVMRTAPCPVIVVPRASAPTTDDSARAAATAAPG